MRVLDGRAYLALRSLRPHARAPPDDSEHSDRSEEREQNAELHLLIVVVVVVVVRDCSRRMRNLFYHHLDRRPPHQQQQQSGLTSMEESNGSTTKLLQEMAAAQSQLDATQHQVSASGKRKDQTEEGKQSAETKSTPTFVIITMFKNILKLVIVLALLSVYNQLIVNRMEWRLRRELLAQLAQLDSGDCHHHHDRPPIHGHSSVATEILNGGGGGGGNATITRQKRQAAPDDYPPSGDDADDSYYAASAQSDSASSSTRPDKWLLDYLTGNGELERRTETSRQESGEHRNSNNKTTQQAAAQCLCPPGKLSFFSLLRAHYLRTASQPASQLEATGNNSPKAALISFRCVWRSCSCSSSSS